MIVPSPPKRVRSTPIRRSRLPGRWSWRLELDDHRVLVLRPMNLADAEPIRQSFALLSPEEVRMRFLHPIKELTPEAARRLATINPAKEFALVLAEPLPPGEALVGAVARVAIDPDARRAEFAILVSRFLAGKGLGRLMMKQLIRWARLKRVETLYGDVLDENRPMLRLADSLGFCREPMLDEPGVTRVSLDLTRRAGKR